MTCIVGLVDNGKAYIGGDSAGVAGLSIITRSDDKVFRNGEFIMEFTSSFRMGQLLRYHFVPPLCNTWDIEKYMVTDFTDAVRLCLRTGSFSRINSNEEEGGTFLVGFRQRLFQICDDYQVGWNSVPFDAIGCGYHKVLVAPKAAETYNAGVRGPFKIVSL